MKNGKDVDLYMTLSQLPGILSALQALMASVSNPRTPGSCTCQKACKMLNNIPGYFPLNLEDGFDISFFSGVKPNF